MRDTGLYERLLDVRAPWRVAGVELRVDEKEVVVRLEADQVLWGCPECGRRMHVHDRAVRRWRHLDTCQFRTILEAEVPRVKCPEHGTVTVRVPWAECRSRFTALFERLAIDVLGQCSVKVAADLLGVSWDEADGIKARAVARGLRRKRRKAARAICIDEKAVGKGHDYVTVVTKAYGEGACVDFIGDGRGEDALEGFWAAEGEEGRKAMRCVCMDMWRPYISAVEENVPGAARALCHDRFHVVGAMNRAVDEVRRQEARLLGKEEARELKGARYALLYGLENLPPKWEDRIAEMKRSKLRTARAWRLKETLREMYACANWAQARSLFETWHRDAMASRLRPVMKVARMLRNHLEGVLNFFIHRATNAYSESLNRIIQDLINRANGYRNRARLKRDLFFRLGGLDLYPDLAQ